ncbi:hypothetical protein ABZ614_34605 [Streptomyces sp. NPDC013178]|uniref:hypothetical protein n=1 Tax=Streptomyces sp. NPDC013178 TaxID=3155118 RepID=UPI00340C0430
MSEPMRSEEKLQLAQWHLARSDQLRLGLVSRASALLSANALVMTGIVVVSSSVSSRIAPIVGASALIALAVSTYSATLVAGVLTGSGNLPTLSRQPHHPPAIAFSYGDTLKGFSTQREFQDQFLAQSAEEAAKDAALELWRCISLHHLRTIKLQRATRCLLASALILAITTTEKLFFSLF